ncbi:unnamed protein product [Brachionus calyciflorus]|uniref:Uncharacterized protein n=1 Tax=Brachionus calyciflorus TaxID=104777 RepID=A0A814ECU6_9BILA|nr:unnamed protein product [Brachionus calyciflorus]
MFFKQNNNLSQSCFDESGIYNGLIRICKELNLIESDVNSNKISLEKLRDIISIDPAFKVDCPYLERLAFSHGNTVLYCPKFHCELNPVESVFCD